MDVMDEGAIAVSQLCKLLDRIKEKRMVPEEEIRKELNDAQFETFANLVQNLSGVKYDREKKTFEVEE